MNFRRFLMLAIAGLVITGASLSPLFTISSQAPASTIQLADGDFPVPEECGLYDICRVAENS